MKATADRGVAEVISEGKVFEGKVAVTGVVSFPNLGLVAAVMVAVIVSKSVDNDEER